MDSALSPQHDELIASAIKKFFTHIIPMLVVMLIINQIDRANIGFIKAELRHRCRDQRGGLWAGRGPLFYRLCAV